MSPRGTPIRSVRISDELWEPAKAKAEREGREGGVSEVIQAALARYITTPDRKPRERRITR